MKSPFSGYEYDIFISYRHNDNRSGWVTEFVLHLNEELASTFKEPVSVYFDTNPHDGLLETHDVDASLKEKVKSLIFIPIVSKTYCDPKSFAWQNEFLPFLEFATHDAFGLNVRLDYGNVARRVLPVRIHEIDLVDKKLFEDHIGGVMRPVDFIYHSKGVNRPLNTQDDKLMEPGKILYRDQINKVANAVKEIIDGLKENTNREFQPSDNKISQQTKKPRLSPGKIALAAIILLVSIIGYFMISDFFKKPNTDRVSIAIIPFHNQTKDINLNSYAFGIASDIRTQLALSGRFDFITSDQATKKYQNSNLSPKEIAAELNVDYLLFGNFYQLGDQLKIAVELSDAATNKSLWSLPLNLTSVESVKQLFDIQVKISEKVMAWFSFAGKVESQLPTDNLAAYQYFLEAKESWEKNLSVAGELFAKAIQLDSNFLSAQVGLFKFEDDRLWRQGNDKIIRENELKPLLDRIVKLSPDSWETYLAKGIFFYHQMKDYDKGFEFLLKSISINPEGEEAISYAGALCRRKLNHEAAMKLTLKSIDINPQLATNWNELALILKDNGNMIGAMRSQLIARKYGMNKGFNYSLIAYFALEDSTLFQIPEDVRQLFGIHYWRNLAKEQRDWSGLLTITDTAMVTENYTNFYKNLDRAFAYYFMDKFELAKIFAARAQKEMGKRVFFTNLFYPEDIYFLLGENENGLQLLNERITNYLENNTHNGQNIQDICSHEIERIILLAFAGQYEVATESLVQLNKRYPAWGNYRLLYTDFRTDKIRNEYPPFNNALQNLKLPAKLEFPERYKNL